MSIANIEVFGQLFLAVLLGAAVGLERELAHKKAGMRTFALVSLGSCLFSLISVLVTKQFPGAIGLDPLRIASQVVVGIGFIGAGVIINRQTDVRGVTTAAGLWVVAAVGMAVGYKLYAIAVFSSAAAIAVLVLLWFVEAKIVNRFRDRWDSDETK